MILIEQPEYYMDLVKSVKCGRMGAKYKGRKSESLLIQADIYEWHQYDHIDIFHEIKTLIEIMNGKIKGW